MQVDRRQIQNIDSVRDIKKRYIDRQKYIIYRQTRKLDMYKMEGQIQKIDVQIKMDKLLERQEDELKDIWLDG